jgi:hypothetical protein
MRDSDIADLLAYAVELDPTLDADEYAVELWTDLLRGIATDLDTARTALHDLARHNDRITLPEVREMLLPLDPRAARRWGTAIVAPNPHEKPYQREQRRRRGLEKARVALAQRPLPLAPDHADGPAEPHRKEPRQ